MVSPRKLLGSVAVGGAVVVLTAMLTGSASAQPGTGCNSETSGAQGLTCAHVGSDLYPGIAANLHLGNPGAVVNVPTCPEATAALVQAHIIVGGVNGKPGTSGRLVAATNADNAANATVRAAEKADRAEDARDAAIATAQGHVSAANAEFATANAMPADTGNGHAKADAIKLAQKHQTDANTELTTATASDTEVGGKEDPGDTEDAAVAVAKAAAFDADQRLEQATKAEGKAEQALVDLEVTVGQACRTPVVIPPATPTPTTDTPAPPAPNEPVVISPALPSDGSAPTPVPVQGNLPVTG